MNTRETAKQTLLDIADDQKDESNIIDNYYEANNKHPIQNSKSQNFDPLRIQPQIVQLNCNNSTNKKSNSKRYLHFLGERKKRNRNSNSFSFNRYTSCTRDRHCSSTSNQTQNQTQNQTGSQTANPPTSNTKPSKTYNSNLALNSNPLERKNRLTQNTISRLLTSKCL